MCEVYALSIEAVCYPVNEFYYLDLPELPYEIEGFRGKNSISHFIYKVIDEFDAQCQIIASYRPLLVQENLEGTYC